MTTIRVGGRELALVFNIEAMDEMETRLGVSVDLANLKSDVVDRLRDRHILTAVAAIMARQGEYLAGREPDFDETWLKRHMKPGQQLRLYVAVVDALTEGMMMETAEGGNDEEVDVVLEELKKKQTRVG